MLLESLTIRPYIENDSIRNFYIYKNAGARMSFLCLMQQHFFKKSSTFGLTTLLEVHKGLKDGFHNGILTIRFSFFRRVLKPLK